MDNLDTREWLITNGLGSFASGTVCDARSRTYHGWLVAALNPPSQRTLLLSHIDASLQVGSHTWAISTNFWGGGSINPLGYKMLRSFEIEPVPTWIWGEEEWQLQRQLFMPYGLVSAEDEETEKNATQFENRILIQYRYEGKEKAILRLRPLIGDRDFHHQQSGISELNFAQTVEKDRIQLQAFLPNWMGTPWQLRWNKGNYQQDGVWYWNYHYPEEKLRGLGDREDFYSPGYLAVTLQPGETVTLEARVGDLETVLPQLNCQEFDQAIIAEEQRIKEIFPQLHQNNNPKLLGQLLKSTEQFITYRASVNSPTVIAGYPWFNDWGRDTLIALPGLALTTGRTDLAKGLLETFGRYCRDGLIPNTFPDAGSDPIYNSIDAALWWIEILGLYLEATQDWDFLAQQYPVVRQIYKAFMAGTLYNIRVDASDGLLTWDAPGVAITWMDAVIDGEPMTPRLGKAVEINALWYSALCWANQWANQLLEKSLGDPVRLTKQAQHYTQQAEQVKASLQKFWNPSQRYFYDTLAPDDRPDASIRPNAVLALSLHHCGFDFEQARSVLEIARDRLLTPYGLRSLSPDDPNYIGIYTGDRWHRDRAYHQGTVWSWLIGSFIRAWKRFYPSEPIPFNWEPLIEHFQQQACLNSVSEIFDGDFPHSPQGAFAQAWSVAELIRHL